MVFTENESAVSNLLAAYEGELNAHAKYRAFAAQAESEGLFGAASLFRAAARAEQIHASNHARVIRHMGGEALAIIRPIKVRTTLENLRTALSGEQNEVDALYPAFLAYAHSQMDTSAARSFAWAIESEKSHAKLYSEAVASFESGTALDWTEEEREFFVCTLCGYTAQTEESENCPACNFLWERFERIR